MIIKWSPFSPIDSEETLTIVKRSDVLTVNGERFDFRPLPDGATLPAAAINCEWIEQDVKRVDGELIITFRLPVGQDASSAARFPVDTINPADGIVSIPQ
ncbi:hypothetical protein [Pseudomonas sp. 25 R 14]|uniref:hypothetical protein n=1 Tax=Pseudomonas sp. 25 R 14 TaxID=1844109 RepID=UPI000812BAA3|nr:hypothetical protein [Pseudomonas sp. 25 R 14]CRM72839.1 hypothetical protein [Pseudomonas sp. 25 R 14]